jgi:hypothetical protein
MRWRAVARTVVLLALLSAPGSARPTAVKRFPRGFLWGTAISRFQTEMGRERNDDRGSDWWVWTHDRRTSRRIIGAGTLERCERGSRPAGETPTRPRTNRPSDVGCAT